MAGMLISAPGCSRDRFAENKQQQPTQQPASKIEEAAVDKLPDFESYDLYGNKITQDVFKDSKLTIVTLWGTF